MRAHAATTTTGEWETDTTGSNNTDAWPKTADERLRNEGEVSEEPLWAVVAASLGYFNIQQSCNDPVATREK